MQMTWLLIVFIGVYSAYTGFFFFLFFFFRDVPSKYKSRSAMLALVSVVAACKKTGNVRIPPGGAAGRGRYRRRSSGNPDDFHGVQAVEV